MRYFDLILTPEAGGIHPVDALLASETSLTRESLLHVDAFADGTGVLLYRMRGDPDAVSRLVADHESVLDWDVMVVDEDGVFHLYLHVTPGEPAGTLMNLSYEYALIVDTPIEFTDRGGIVVTVIGTHELLRDALRDIPEDVHISIRQVGHYSPTTQSILSRLTDRQREVFETAVELGYYEIPRRVNQSELADELGCAPSTVDEHLRKAESKILSGLIQSVGQ